MKQHLKKLQDMRKNEDPRLSFSTPEFKEAQRIFTDGFKVCVRGLHSVGFSVICRIKHQRTIIYTKMRDSDCKTLRRLFCFCINTETTALAVPAEKLWPPRGVWPR